MILDNADDVSIFFNVCKRRNGTPLGNSGGTTSPLLAAYLPESPNGSILVTTRDEDVAYRLTGGDKDIVRIKPMEEDHAFALLRKKLGDEIDKEAATALGAALGYIPLAITQAAAYIRQREPRCSLQLYIDNFHRNDQSKASLLEYDSGDLRRDLRVSNSVIITWQISFDYIRQTTPSAANLLSLMSFFDRQGIPAALLQPDSGTTNSDGTSSACNDGGIDARSECNINNEFEDDIVVLKNFSLITVNVDGDTFEMHSLVQLSTRKWLRENGQLERWKQDYVARLCEAFPPGKYENWESCESLFAHAEAAVEQKPTEQNSIMNWARLLYNAGWYAWTKGNLKEAEKMLQNTNRAREEFLEQEDLDRLAGMALFGQVLETQGRYEEAEEMHQRALDGYSKALGQEHPDTLTSIADLASTYQSQGRWKEAEDLKVQVMETSLRVLGQEHPDTLTSIANLAWTYQSQGRWKEAEDLEVQVVETSLRVLGQEHPDTLTSIANLASTYQSQGRRKEAEDLDVQVVETSLRVLGQEHPDTLTSIANLASTYQSQGRWKEAEAEDQDVQVMETSLRVLGQEHPDTLTSIANLAWTYQSQGRWKEAEDLEVQVMETKERVLGLEHPSTLISMNNLAFTLKSQGRHEEAVALMTQCVNLRKIKLGVDHPDTKFSLTVLNEWQT
jgi:tetratricopeptide (TPR) repeat protein